MGRWLSANGRWGSPVFIAGESYGGYRVGRLVRMLQETPGIGLNGAILISPALEIATLGLDRLRRRSPWVDLAADDGARCRHHGRSRAFARRHAARGRPAGGGDVRDRRLRGLPDARRVDARRQSASGSSRRLADLIGLPIELVARAEGRITISVFTRELLRDERKVLGLYDATITSTDPFPDRESFAGPDPTLAGISPAYTDRDQPAAALGDRRRDRPRVHGAQPRGEPGVEERRTAALLRPARRRDRRLPLRHVAQPAHEGVHHARPLRPRDAVLRERPPAEPDAARPGDGRAA